jgi:hypothetical protein
MLDLIELKAQALRLRSFALVIFNLERSVARTGIFLPNPKRLIDPF